MHPFLNRRGWFRLYLAAWAPLALLVAALLALAGLPPVEALAVGLPLVLVYSQIGLSAWYVCRALPLRFERESGWDGWEEALRPVVTLGAAAAVSSGLWLLLGRAWSGALALTPTFAGAVGHYQEAIPLVFGLGVVLYLLAAAGHYLALAWEASRAAERREMELTVLAREAELRALRAQVDPHFLFNSLNTLAALAGSDPAGARRTALMLADFLRRTLRLGERDEVALGEELALARAYLAVEQVRFGDRLAFEERIADGLDRIAVPPLILLPLIENAVKHGIAGLVTGGRVTIEVRPRGGDGDPGGGVAATDRDGDDEGDRSAGVHAGTGAVVSIVNDRDPDASAGRLGEGIGLGLSNVRRRLAARYGRDARLGVAAEPGRFRVELHFPPRPPRPPAASPP